MNEIFAWFGLGVLILILLSKIPGLEHFVKPIIDLIFTAIKFIAENCYNWVIWTLKNLFSSHFELVRHLTQTPKSLDPSQEVRDTDK